MGPRHSAHCLQSAVYPGIRSSASGVTLEDIKTKVLARRQMLQQLPGVRSCTCLIALGKTIVPGDMDGLHHRMPAPKPGAVLRASLGVAGFTMRASQS